MGFGVVVAEVPGADGFYAQGETFEEARENLRDVIEGDVILALELDWAIPNCQGSPHREHFLTFV